MHASRHPASDKYDADLILLIPATAEEGGSSRTQEINVHIKFAPPLKYLILSITIGSLVGALCRLFLVFRVSKRWTWPEFVVGLIYAIVFWCIAFILSANGMTTVKIWGLPFDPTQLFPAGVLCLVAGGGPPLLKLLDDFVVNRFPGGKKP
jgi:hypothetical protein